MAKQEIEKRKSGGQMCHAYGWSLCLNPQYLEDRSMYTGTVTETGSPWEIGNGLTGDERTWITLPGSVSLNLEHHWSLLLGGRGEDPYLWALPHTHVLIKVRKKPLSNPAHPRGSHCPVTLCWALCFPSPWQQNPVAWFLPISLL